MSDAADSGRGRLFVISGPSGSGKTSIMRKVRALPEIYYSVSATSRKPRPGEIEGVDYRFVTRERFEEMIGEDGLAEHFEVAGNLYGTPREPLEEALAEGRTAVVDIDVRGAMRLKESFPEARLVFIKPPGSAELEQRLRGRGTEDEETIRRRLALAEEEMTFESKYDVSVTNDDLDRATDEVVRIILGS
jgi:guanylate kinase